LQRSKVAGGRVFPIYRACRASVIRADQDIVLTLTGQDFACRA